MTRRFTMGIDPADSGRRRHWMNVVVHDTAQELRRAAHKLKPMDDEGLDYWADCDGCFQPHDGNSGYLGIMRLCEQSLTADVIVHESLHAAVAYTWKGLGLKAIHLNPYSAHSMAKREEVLAYAVQGISTALLREFGIVAATAA